MLMHGAHHAATSPQLILGRGSDAPPPGKAERSDAISAALEELRIQMPHLSQEGLREAEIKMWDTYDQASAATGCRGWPYYLITI